MSASASAPTRALGLVLRYLALPLSIIVALLLWEFVASQTMDERGQFRLTPASVWLGHAVGRMAEAEITATTLAEAERQRATAEATQRGQLTAQNELQPVLERQMQAIRVEAETRLQATIQAYANLYARYSQAVDVASRMEQYILQTQQNVAATGMAGNAMIANFADVLCAFGAQNACGQGAQTRQQMAMELARLGRAGSLFPREQFLSSVDDPATVITRATMPPIVAQPTPPSRPTPAAPQAGATAVRYEVLRGRVLSNNGPLTIFLGSDGNAHITTSSGAQNWFSYTEERRGNDRRICFRTTSGQPGQCKLLRPLPDNTFGWVNDDPGRTRGQTTSIITSIENQ